MTSPTDPSAQRSEPDQGEIINFRAARNWIRFAFAAAGRRGRVVFGAMLALFLLALAALQVIPRKFQVECRLLAQRSTVLVTRADGQTAPDPSQSASGVVLASDNLNALIKQTDLVKEWNARRSFVFRQKDRLMALLARPQTVAEQSEHLAEYLKDRIKVWASEGTITISLTWPDGEMAYRLADAAQRSFLEARHVQEVTAFVESVSILEGHAAEAARQVDSAMRELQERREKKQGGRPSSEEAASNGASGASQAARAPRPVAPSAPVSAPELSPEVERRLAELPVQIAEKTRIVDELEGVRRRRLSELQAKLEEQRAMYTEAHPIVADTKQAIEVATQQSPQVTHLRAELQDLKAELERLSGRAEKAGTGSARSFGGPAAVATGPREAALAELARREEERDPETEYARSKLKFAIDKHQSIQEEIRRTRLDLDTAQAAFKYRYVLVSPPERPRGPISPQPVPILIVALICGGLIGVIGATALELKEGLIRERWQVEQLLALPVLTEIQLRVSNPEKPA